MPTARQGQASLDLIAVAEDHVGLLQGLSRPGASGSGWTANFRSRNMVAER